MIVCAEGMNSGLSPLLSYHLICASTMCMVTNECNGAEEKVMISGKNSVQHATRDLSMSHTIDVIVIKQHDIGMHHYTYSIE